MVRIRWQFSIARLLGAIAAAAFPFALVGPGGAALCISVGILIPIFVVGFTTLDVVVILALACTLAAMLTPPVTTNRYRSRRPGALAGKSVESAPVPTSPVVPATRDSVDEGFEDKP